jgi:hypothetical protein
MLRSFTVMDPHLVSLIRSMMVKEARYVDDALNGSLPLHEPQPVALKATSSKEALHNKWRLPGSTRMK